jgi:hypothetical protein
MNAPARLAALPATITMPTLAHGELYAGLVLEDGAWHHVVKLAGESSPVGWKKAQEWAKEKGGELPSRSEQALLYANLREEFRKDWYWSGTPSADDEGYAWCQGFGNGGQGCSHKSAASAAPSRSAEQSFNDSSIQPFRGNQHEKRFERRAAAAARHCHAAARRRASRHDQRARASGRHEYRHGAAG